MQWLKSPTEGGGSWIWCPKCDAAYKFGDALKEGQSILESSNCFHQFLILPSRVKVLGVQELSKSQDQGYKKLDVSKAEIPNEKIQKLEEKVERVCQAITDLQIKVANIKQDLQRSGNT